MERTLVDGVPVLWAPAPGPLTAGLVLGVGRRDESVVRGGLTHLVEHLAMRALGRTTLDCNATVDVASTQFTATGTPEQVTGSDRITRPRRAPARPGRDRAGGAGRARSVPRRRTAWRSAPHAACCAPASRTSCGTGAACRTS